MKTKTIYECKECGSRTAKWTGKCTNCGAWNSLIEKTTESSSGKVKMVPKNKTKVFRLNDIAPEDDYRISTKINELDRVLGGGVIPGSLVLVGGDPGIGKSTLMLQMCAKIAQRTLYITGEESLKQVRFKSERLKDISGEMHVAAETSLENIVDIIKETEAEIIIVDSIQSISTVNVDAAPGSQSQVRECASILMRYAKTLNKAIFIIGHVTKEGIIAGPKLLEHLVDTVLQFEGEKSYAFRILRSLKNRFGSTNELGIFEMSNDGLKQVENPSEIFLDQSSINEPGVAIAAAIEGTRPLLLEIQALVSTTNYGVPQRTSTAYDGRRLQMILAVLEKRLGLQFRQNDVFVNVVGGVYINDTSLDLAIAAALVSSLRDLNVNSKTVFIGEMGLTGEIRAVQNMEKRISEAAKLGFERAVIAKSGIDRSFKVKGIELTTVEKVSSALVELI
jgi:DNA repair protein RadA/Sms